MKKRNYLLIITLFIFQLACNGQNMEYNTMRIKLKEGTENKAIRFGNLIIEPVELSIFPKPWSDHSAGVILNLNIEEAGEKCSADFQYYGNDNKGMFPIAFQSYLLDMIVTDSDTATQVELVVDKNDFDREFFLRFEHKAIIDNLTVHFEHVGLKWLLPPEGPSYEVGYYSFSLSTGSNQTILAFTSNQVDEDGTISFEWNEYTIHILYSGHEIIKMKVTKR